MLGPDAPTQRVDQAPKSLENPDWPKDDRRLGQKEVCLGHRDPQLLEALYQLGQRILDSSTLNPERWCIAKQANRQDLFFVRYHAIYLSNECCGAMEIVEGDSQVALLYRLHKLVVASGIGGFGVREERPSLPWPGLRKKLQELDRLFHLADLFARDTKTGGDTHEPSGRVDDLMQRVYSKFRAELEKHLLVELCVDVGAVVTFYYPDRVIIVQFLEQQ